MPETPENRSFGSRLGHNFLTGMFLVLPLGLTLYIISFLVGLIASPVESVFQAVFPLFFPNKEGMPDFKTGLNHGLLVLASALVMAVILSGLGFLSKRLFGKVLQRWFAGLLERMPGLGALYNSIRQMVDALSGRNKDTFRRVVMIEFPRPGMWTIAFVTHEQPTVFSQAIGKPVVNVFVPAAPAPTTGVILHLSPEEVRETKLTVGEALGLLMSFGSVIPKPDDKS
ncbi:MAG: hypothetical protein CK522_02970 [Opitutia bacterium]|nr:MAG: hypothetical protein CK522_02970 [Opitutae bacterium]